MYVCDKSDYMWLYPELITLCKVYRDWVTTIEPSIQVILTNRSELDSDLNPQPLDREANALPTVPLWLGPPLYLKTDKKINFINLLLSALQQSLQRN